MVAILKERSTDGVLYQIDDPEAYERLTSSAGAPEAMVHYRVFVDTETERRFRERMVDLDAQIKEFFEFGEQGRCELSVTVVSAGSATR